MQRMMERAIFNFCFPRTLPHITPTQCIKCPHKFNNPARLSGTSGSIARRRGLSNCRINRLHHFGCTAAGMQQHRQFRMRLQWRFGSTHRCQHCGNYVKLSVCAVWLRTMLFEQCLHRRQVGNASNWSIRDNGSCIAQMSPSVLEGFATNPFNC